MLSIEDVAEGSGSGLTPVRIALIYVVGGRGWIALSDQLVAALPVDRALVTQLQVVKGWVFVRAAASPPERAASHRQTV